MSPEIADELAMMAVAAVFVVMWWLLRNKDEAQAEQIALLFRKHDDDAQRLENLRLEIARNHYERAELDKRFDRLDQTIAGGLERIGEKVDHLANVMMSHISKEPTQ